MDYYCDICDKTIKSKSKLLRSLSHIEFDKCIRTKHTIEYPDFFDMDKIFKDYITNRNKKFDLYLVRYDFQIFFDEEFYPRIQSEFQYNTKSFLLKRFLLNWIEYFSERGHKFSQIDEMNITTVSNKRYMNYEIYIKQLMQMVELNLNMIISKNPHVITSLDRSINHS